MDSYKKVASSRGEKPVKIGIYNFDTMKYEKFPQEFVADDPKFYFMG